jgi:cytochrome c biogenesis protein CcmG, thiol:disulfide interchange protein DsbE
MSKRQIAALAAVVIVPVALLAVVLLTILSDDDQQARPVTELTTPDKPRSQQRKKPEPPASSGSAPAPTNKAIDRQLARRRPVPAPDVSFPVLDEGTPPSSVKEKIAPTGDLSLGELRGTPVVLSLWSSWCTLCGAAAQVVQTESERYGPRGVLFLGLDVQDTERDAQRFRKKYNLDYPTASDESGDAARQLGATGVPETFFISGDGQIVGHVVGAATIAQMELGTSAAQAGKPFRTQQAGARLPLR